MRAHTADWINGIFWVLMGLSVFFALLLGGTGAWGFECRPAVCALQVQWGVALLSLTALFELGRIETLRWKTDETVSVFRRLTAVVGLVAPPSLAYLAPALISAFFLVGLIILAVAVVVAHLAKK